MDALHSSSSSSSSSIPASAEVGVGASDTILLAVSGVGFCFLAWTVYSIIITKLKTRQDLANEVDENGNEISYDDRLAKADVSTLNRAQRRARARHIMKQQRRVAPLDGTAALAGDHDDNQNNNNNMLQNGNGEAPMEGMIPPMNNDQIQVQHPNLRHLSRKERNERAKQKEREERRALDSDRQKEQRKLEQAEQEQKRERERQKSIQLEKERQQRIQKQEEDELDAYNAWRTFLPKHPANTDNSSSSTTTVLTVKEWIQQLEVSKSKSVDNRIISIRSIADEHGVSTDQVCRRIRELIAEGRVTGILHEQKEEEEEGDESMSDDDKVLSDGYYFIYVSKKELATIASTILQEEERLTLEDLRRIIIDQLDLKHT